MSVVFIVEPMGDSFFGSFGGSKNKSTENMGLLTAVVSVVTPNDSLCPSMTLKQRVMGFVLMVGIGIILSILSGVILIFGDIKNFAILYSVGNVVAIAATCFLIGPVKQLKNMVDPERVVSTIIFFLALGATIAIALTIKNGLLVLIFVVIQWAAFVWYSISYIPFAQSCIKRAVGSLLD